MAKKYAMATGKMTAGSCRFLFEDVLQGSCQAVWLCKQWNKTTLFTKGFTLASIGSGLVLSLAVPLKEYIAVRSIQKQAEAANASEELNGAIPADATSAAKEDAYLQVKTVPAGEQELCLWPAKVTVSDFLMAPSGHGRTAHTTLMASAVMFWGSMAVYPKIFGDQITCDGTPPALGQQIFFGHLCADIVLQAWVLNHTRNGYNMLVHNMRGFVSGVLFSTLGRFDTYGDVAFTYKLRKCEPITWFSIWGNVFNLPFPLEYFAVFALVVGILCLQAIPGLFLLCRQSRLPMAMKFNEFNLVLNVMQEEAAREEMAGDYQLVGSG